MSDEHTDDAPGIGHNNVAAGQLRALIERIERLTEEKDALSADIREVFSEAKATGFDTKIMRQIIKLRKLDPSDRQAQKHLLETYASALEIPW